MLEVRWALLAALFVSSVRPEVADFGQPPKGENPTLYDAQLDPIVQLDETTFNDTVYCSGNEDCTAFIVEFYSDWCGHCRAYAPLYKNLARDVRGWDEIVRVAAMNCADSMNEATCRANHVTFFPFIKYFPRNSTSVDDGLKLKTFQSARLMRDQLTKSVLAEYQQQHHANWPTFEVLKPITTYSELFVGIDPSIHYIALVFEDDAESMVGLQLLLDLHRYRSQIASRRVFKGHALTDALRIADYPTVAVFKKGEHEPILQAELRRLLLTEIEGFLRSNSDIRGLTFSSHPSNRTSETASDSGEQHEASEAQQQIQMCDKEPEKCKALYYVSESDMLKAVRYALVREVTRSGGDLTPEKLTNLYTFVDTLATHFPYSTIDAAENGTEQFLNASSRARVVFTHMRDYLKENGLEKPLSVDDWQAEFVKAEADQGKPFPTTEPWQHCAGSTPQLRGYTCGLWTTFHALTVRAFRNSGAEPDFKPASVLQAIRGWVSSFFGCEHCRHHFLKMTTKTFVLEDHVHKADDVFLYLWKAHNIVNARLKGRDTEDPKYPKLQFPARFLCKDCNVGGDNNKNETLSREYVLNYYSSIRPLIDPTEEALSS